MQLTMAIGLTAKGEKDSKVWDATQPNTDPNKSMLAAAAAAFGYFMLWFASGFRTLVLA